MPSTSAISILASTFLLPNDRDLLCQCSLVSQEWREAFQTQLFSQATVCVDPSPRPDMDLLYRLNSRIPTVIKTLKVFTNRTKSPYADRCFLPVTFWTFLYNLKNLEVFIFDVDWLIIEWEEMKTMDLQCIAWALNELRKLKKVEIRRGRFPVQLLYGFGCGPSLEKVVFGEESLPTTRYIPFRNYSVVYPLASVHDLSLHGRMALTAITRLQKRHQYLASPIVSPIFPNIRTLNVTWDRAQDSHKVATILGCYGGRLTHLHLTYYGGNELQGFPDVIINEMPALLSDKIKLVLVTHLEAEDMTSLSDTAGRLEFVIRDWSYPFLQLHSLSSFTLHHQIVLPESTESLEFTNLQALLQEKIPNALQHAVDDILNHNSLSTSFKVIIDIQVNLNGWENHTDTYCTQVNIRKLYWRAETRFRKPGPPPTNSS